MFDANGRPIELKQVQVSCWPKKDEAKGDLKPWPVVAAEVLRLKAAGQ